MTKWISALLTENAHVGYGAGARKWMYDMQQEERKGKKTKKKTELAFWED